jgi:hypothetical protein
MEFSIPISNHDSCDHKMKTTNKIFYNLTPLTERQKKINTNKTGAINVLNDQTKSNYTHNDTIFSNNFRTNFSAPRFKSNGEKDYEEKEESTLKNKKKFIFMKEIAKKIENEQNQENKFRSGIHIPKIKFDQSVNLMNTLTSPASFKGTSGTNSQFFPSKRNSKIDMFNEEDFEKTIDYIKNISLSKVSKNNKIFVKIPENVKKIKLKIPHSLENSKHFKSKSKSKKQSELNSPSNVSFSDSEINSETFRKKSKINKNNNFYSLSNSNANSNSKSNFSKQTYFTNDSNQKNPQTFAEDPSQVIRKNYSKEILKTIKKINNKNEIITVKTEFECNKGKKILLKDNFKRIQDKMQNIVNSQLKKKGECYIPNLKSLIKMNNYIIRDFNIGGNSTVNSKYDDFIIIFNF